MSASRATTSGRLNPWRARKLWRGGTLPAVVQAVVRYAPIRMRLLPAVILGVALAAIGACGGDGDGGGGGPSLEVEPIRIGEVDPEQPGDVMAFAGDSVWVLTLDGRVTRVRAESGAVERPSSITGVAGLASADGSLWALLRDGRIVEIDPGTGRVGSRGVDTKTSGSEMRFAVGGGYGWIVNAFDRELERVDLESGESKILRLEYGGEGAIPKEAAFGEGHLWIVDSQENIVLRVDPASGHAEPGSVQLRPYRVAVGEGAVWVTTEQAIVKVDPRDLTIDPPIRLPVGEPQGIAAGQGSVWVTSPGNVTRVDPKTIETSEPIEVGERAAPGTVLSRAVAVGGGSAWVLDPASRTLSRIRP
jgi:streptogramin lyase